MGVGLLGRVMGRNIKANSLDETSISHIFSGIKCGIGKKTRIPALGTIFFLAIILLSSRIAVGSSIPIEVSIQAPSQFVNEGQEFTINISIDPLNNPISGAQFNLVFNGSLGRIKNISEGDLFKINGAKTLFNHGVLNNTTGNLVNVWGLIITPRASIIKKNNLAVITFISNGAGTFRLNLTDVIICNPESISLQTRITNISLIINDTKAPASVTYLRNSTYSHFYIKWTWIDPKDPDFSKVMIYFNGQYNTSVPKGTSQFNATGLAPDTAYKISLRTVDAAGNINSTWVNHTAKTAPAPANVVFFDDMERGTEENWDASGLWHITERDSAISNHSFWYGQESSGNYDTFSNGIRMKNYGYLTSPKISLSGVTNPKFYFMSRFQVEPYDSVNYDNMWVQISTDNELTWINLLKISGAEETWNPVTIDLSEYSGNTIRIRFYFTTVDSYYNEYEGWYIDDVKIYQSSK